MITDFLERENKALKREVMRNQSYHRSRTPNPRLRAAISFEQLAIALSIPPDLTQMDLDYLLGEQELLEKDKEATQATFLLLQTRQFKSWFLDEGSYLLLADGNDKAHATKSISVMTLLCVSIIGSLRAKARRDPRVIVLYFFCSMHAHETEGPRLMVKSIVMQLLLAMVRANCCIGRNQEANGSSSKGVAP